MQAFRDIVRVNEKRVKSGDLAEVELLRVQLAELQFENAVRQAELRVSTAQARLQLLLGRTALPNLRRHRGTTAGRNSTRARSASGTGPSAST